MGIILKKAINHKPTRHKLIYNQEEYAMHIPADYYEATSMEIVIKSIKSKNCYSDCTFETIWTIKDKSLFLIEVNIIALNEDSTITRYNIIKELFDNEKVKAVWVKEHTVSIVCKDEHKPMKLHITINNGIVTNQEKRAYRKIQKKT